MIFQIISEGNLESLEDFQKELLGKISGGISKGVSKENSEGVSDGIRGESSRLNLRKMF